MSGPIVDIDYDEIWVVAPHGFRPSKWVEMLRDYDSAYDVDPHLVDERLVGHQDVLIIEGEILDPSHPQAEARLGCFWELLEKVAEMGLHLSCDPTFLTQRSDWWAPVEAFRVQRGLTITFRGE